jgi:hypothetical protein
VPKLPLFTKSFADSFGTGISSSSFGPSSNSFHIANAGGNDERRRRQRIG